MNNTSEYRRVKKAIDKYGVLLLTDKHLPSLVTLVANEPIKGSWWGHPKGNLIYNLAGDFEEREDVLAVKFISGKITYIGKKYWDHLYSIGTSHDDWQLKKTSVQAKNLLKKVNEAATLRADEVPRKTTSEIGKLAKELEKKLLIYTDDIHTESGKHMKVLQSWKQCFKARGYRPKKIDPIEARNVLGKIVIELSSDFKGKATVPW